MVRGVVVSAMAEIQLGLTFDDVLLLPCLSTILPGEADPCSQLCEGFPLRLPILSAPMDTVTEVDEDLIPNGNHPSVENTPFDFRTPRTVGERLSEAFPGYDHNFIFASAPTEKVAGLTLPHVATVKSATRTMDVYTDQPCMQFYTGNFLGGKPDFKGGVERRPRHAFCMETQTEPDLVNHSGGILPAGETYRHTTVYRIRNY